MSAVPYQKGASWRHSGQVSIKRDLTSGGEGYISASTEQVERDPAGAGEHEGGDQCFAVSDVSTRNCRYAEYFA